MLLNTVVCFPTSPLLKKKNELSLTATLQERKKRRKYSAFSCLQSIFYHPHPVKLTFPSELLLSDCPSLPHLLPVCPGLVILSHFQLPSLLSLLLFSTGHRFSLLFFATRHRRRFLLQMHIQTNLYLYLHQFHHRRPSFFHLRETFLLGGGGKFSANPQTA